MNHGWENKARFEHSFWLQILGDHSRFILEALAPAEKDSIQRAEELIRNFDLLLGKVQSEDPFKLSEMAENETKKLREFKLRILKRHLAGKIKIYLSPSFLNHMLNELEEYERLISYFAEKQIPPVFHEVHHHLVWLLDATGHADAITGNLDLAERQLKEKSHQYTKQFEAYYLKAEEMAGYLRTNLSTFPSLEKFNTDVALEMKLFQNFLHEIEELRLHQQALGTFSPLMADHMYREECYYLTKLAESANIEKPGCDPAKPRLTEGS